MATIGGYTDNTAPTAAELNAFWPGCVLRNTGSLTLTASTLTDLTFPNAANELSDPLNWHSTTTNTQRITPTVTGYYRVTGNVAVNNTLGTVTYLQLIKVATIAATESSDESGTNPSGVSLSWVGYIDASAGDYLLLQAYHNNASNRTTQTRSFSAHLLGT